MPVTLNADPSSACGWSADRPRRRAKVL